MDETSNTWETLCHDYAAEQNQAQGDELTKVSEKFLTSACEKFRGNSERVSDAFEIAGDAHSAAGREDEAIKYYEEALEKGGNFSPKSTLARLAAKLTLILDHKGRWDDALHRGEESLKAFEEAGDLSFHPMLLNHLGSLCRRQGHLDQSEKYYRRALEMAKDSHGLSHPDTATAMNNLGVTLTEKQDFVQAESVHMEALGLREKAFGPMHPEVAQSMVNLGAVYHWTGQHAKARGFYQGALQIYQSFSAPDDVEVVTARENLQALDNLQ